MNLTRYSAIYRQKNRRTGLLVCLKLNYSEEEGKIERRREEQAELNEEMFGGNVLPHCAWMSESIYVEMKRKLKASQSQSRLESVREKKRRK